MIMCALSPPSEDHCRFAQAPANISIAEAAAAASNARNWMQMQNAGRTSGKIHKSFSSLKCFCTYIAFCHLFDISRVVTSVLQPFKTFQAQDAARTTVQKPVKRTGRRMGTTATCGTQMMQKTGQLLRTSARRRAATQLLYPLIQPTSSSWRE